MLFHQSRWISIARLPRHGPLRILFCGADEFSIHSLRALHALQQLRQDHIESVEVVCRPDKRRGRGLKNIHEVPIKRAAMDLGLKLHQLDTFHGWFPPKPVDIVVTVSFGLLVPERILSAAKYGGLNVHPSLLPELRGPAPIQHALLQGRSHTGVTLQTMHPTRFDHGMILDQMKIEIPPESTVDGVVNVLGPLGANMLTRSIEDDIFVPPLRPLCIISPDDTASYAPKLTAEDRHINWRNWTAEEILCRDRVLGSLWDNTTYIRCNHYHSNNCQPKRVIFHGPWSTDVHQYEYDQTQIISENAGWPIALHERWITNSKFQIKRHPSNIALCTVDGRLIVPAQISIEGQKKFMGKRSLLDAMAKRSS